METKDCVGNCESPESIQARKGQNIVDTKTMRKLLDENLQALKNIEKVRRSRERSIAITKLQESIMWLGMDLKDMDTPTPYPNSYNPANTVIDKTADGLKL
jgi:hypothetical protein